ncbi:unnamed protein product [Cylicostephanus goldi]|uniref:Uncharacterized protein n=1 Tax=Cylicostephanus goldi TaxID=71465 RepID=A0A3P7R4U1_CYLGO|nr:unnamed protein product [Cylicostephanus goldi]
MCEKTNVENHKPRRKAAPLAIVRQPRLLGLAPERAMPVLRANEVDEILRPTEKRIISPRMTDGLVAEGPRGMRVLILFLSFRGFPRGQGVLGSLNKTKLSI